MCGVCPRNSRQVPNIPKSGCSGPGNFWDGFVGFKLQNQNLRQSQPQTQTRSAQKFQTVGFVKTRCGFLGHPRNSRQAFVKVGAKYTDIDYPLFMKDVCKYLDNHLQRGCLNSRFDLCVIVANHLIHTMACMSFTDDFS